VRIATDDDGAVWDTFAYDFPDSTFFHRFGWRQLFREQLGLHPYYLIAERSGKTVGILPLAYQRSRLFGNALIAAPFCVEGGPLARDSDAAEALDDAAIDLIHELKCSSLEYRSRKASHLNWAVKRNFYATFSRSISTVDEENLLAIPRKQRAVVRKSIKSGLVSDVENGVDSLFRVYSESVRNLGTPVFSKRYFQALCDTFGADCDVIVVKDKGQPVSAVLNFYHQSTVMPYYGGGTKLARSNGANDFLYWEVMRRAARRGCHKFDFGRSKADTGAFAFKKNWGFEPHWLEYEYYLLGGARIPEKNPSNPAYARLIRLWKGLPLPIANFIGPYLIGGLG
jgi:FemAB-related protein (PEP-CTERM system-associated)